MAAIHEATGCTPVSLMLGRNLRLPIDLHIGCPEDKASSSTTICAEELEKRLEHVHEFSQTDLKVVSDNEGEI